MRRSFTTQASLRVMPAVGAVAAAVLLMSAPVAAAWGPKFQVSTNDHDTRMFDNQDIVQSVGYLHWTYLTDDGPTYKRTYLDGSSAGSDQLMKLTVGYGQEQGIAADGNLVAVLYSDNVGPKTLELRMSTDGADSYSPTFKPAVIVAHYTGTPIKIMGGGSVAVSGHTVLVAWSDTTNGHVNLRRSTDSGAHFGPIVQLGTTTADSAPASKDGQVHLAMSGTHAVATWFASRTAYEVPSKLVMRRSSDSGASFHARQTLDPGTQDINGPSIAMSGQEVLIAHANKPGDVKVLRSTNGGQSFSSKTLSGTKDSWDLTDIAIDPANPRSVRLVWSHKGTILMRRSSNGGVSWTATEDTKGRADPYSVVGANVAVSSSGTLVGWDSTTNNGTHGYTLIVVARLAH